jgi:aminoglycoside phosphotransferase (APT) family kinase protein
MLVYGRFGEVAAGNTVVNVASAPGYLTESEIISRYESSSGRDLSRLGFYLGLASFKLATILEGIHYRHLQGQTVGEGFAGIGDAIHPLLDTGLKALKEDR